MSSDWALIYRSFTDEELAAERVRLIKQAQNPFISQTEGPRSVARSTSEIRDKLAALTQVQQERGSPGDKNRHLIADFSCVRL